VSAPCIVGIDPGLTGAVAFYAPGSRTAWVKDLPTVQRGIGKARVRRELDAAGLAHLLRPWDIDTAFVEAVSARPGQGVASVFSLGHSLGTICAVLSALGIAWQPVAPAVWKKALRLPSDKEAARAMASRLFPGVDLTRIKDHNRAEALLLAHYGEHHHDRP